MTAQLPPVKRRRCQESVTGNGHRYLFSGTFGNIEAAGFCCDKDPGRIMAALYDGDLPPGDIRSVIMCCMDERDGEPVDDVRREEHALEFVEDFGLQDCAELCKHLLGYALIGDVKKKQIDRDEAIRGLTRKLNPSILMGFVWLGLIWGATCATSAALACLILRYI